MIRELRNENEKLKQLLMMAAKGGTIDFGNPELLARFGEMGIETTNTSKNSVQEIQEKLECNEAEIKDISTPWQEKLQQEKQKEEKKEIQDKTLPHITNLNEDSQLSGMLYYNLNECPIHVGRKNGEPKPKIIIGGIGILPNHAVFEKVEYDQDGNPLEAQADVVEETKTPAKLENIKEENEQEGEDEPKEAEGEGEDHKEEKEAEDVILANPEQTVSNTKLPDFYLKPRSAEACESIFVNGEQISNEVRTNLAKAVLSRRRAK